MFIFQILYISFHSLKMSALEKSEKDLISSVIESIKPSFSDSEIDQETLAKLEQLWIKKLKLLDDQDKLEAKLDEESQSSGSIGDSGVKETEFDRDMDSLVLVVKTDDLEEETSCPKIPEKEVQEDTFKIPQLDGKAESSEDDDDLSDDNDDDLDSGSDLNSDEEDALDGVVGIEMDAPCSADDISDEEASELFDTENVVVCQYEKISRSRNKWKFVLKDGVMNLNGRDYVFQKANGEVDW